MQVNISDKPGLYIHIPFCEKKCGYCDFYSVTDRSSLNAFLQALHNEFSLVREEINPLEPFDTVYFGGGTPSLLTAAEIETILNQLSKHFPLADNVEITLEANPGTIDAHTFSGFRAAGINRLSIGIQSFNDEELRFLGRIHDAAQAEDTIRSAQKAGFENFSLDLIFAQPGQTLKSWRRSLNKALSFEPAHISAYNLVFEEGTPFFTKLQQGALSAQPEESEIRFWEMTLNLLTSAHFPPYEVSSFARAPRYYSRHNIKYWTHTPYLGFGPSAHSFWGKQRWSRPRSVSRYLSEVNQNRLPAAHSETLSSKTLEFEHIFLSLRMYRGLNLNEFERIFKTSFRDKYATEYALLIRNNRAIEENGFFKLTQKGMIICDTILQEFYRP